MSNSSFSSILQMWAVPHSLDVEIYQHGVTLVKALASLGGVVFTIAFLLLSLQLAGVTSAEQKNQIIRKMLFSAVVAFIHYCTWQIAPRIHRIFFYPMESLTVEDRAMYVTRWVASMGGVVFTLAFMILGLYAAFLGIQPVHRQKFYLGMCSTGLGAFLFYTAWLVTPILAGGGIAPGHLDDKALYLIRLTGSLGAAMFTLAFLMIALKMALGVTHEAQRKRMYQGLLLAFIGVLIFYSAWQLAPVIANTFLPSACGSTVGGCR